MRCSTSARRRRSRSLAKRRSPSWLNAISRATAPPRCGISSWWSGLTVRDAKLGIELAKNALVEETIDGRLHWSATATPAPAKRRASPAYLLPNYDEYLIAYKDRPAARLERTANMEARSNGAFPHHLVIDGRLAGSWRRTVKANSVAIEVAPYKPCQRPMRARSTGETECYGEFLNMPMELTIY